MADIEENSFLDLVKQLVQCISQSSQSVVDQKKLKALCFQIIINHRHLVPCDQGDSGISLLKCLQEILSKNSWDAEDKACMEKCSKLLEDISEQYEAADSIFKFLLAMKNTDQKKKLKPNELLSAFQFGVLKHTVPLSQRGQTISDQFSIFDRNLNDLLPVNNDPHHFNPFPRINTSRGTELQLGRSNAWRRSQSQYQDEGYVTPDTLVPSGSLKLTTTIHKKEVKDEIHKEPGFSLDFVPKDSLKQTQKCSQLLMSEIQAASLKDVQLFEHLFSNEDLLRDLKYLMIGAPSRSFHFNKDLKRFILVYGIYSQHISPRTLKTLVEPALQCGNYFIALESLPLDKRLGYVYQMFLRCVKEYLIQHTLDVSNLFPTNTSIPYVKLQEFIEYHNNQIACLAKICSPTLHRGAELLNQIYYKTIESLLTHQKESTILLARILESCTNIYLGFLDGWLFEGEFNDNFKEFLVHRGSNHQMRNRIYWSKGFSFEKVNCPSFLINYEKEILGCGKNISLLKLTNPENPLFSVKYKDRPKLKCYLTEESLTQFRSHCEEYEKNVIELCGSPPQLANLLKPKELSPELIMKYQKQSQAKREELAKKMKDERLRKLEEQAKKRKIMLKEIEEIERRKREEKEREHEMDLKLIAEAKKRDEEYEKARREEKQRVEDYYRGLMKVIEERQAQVTDKTQRLKTLKSFLNNRKNSRHSLDSPDGKKETHPKDEKLVIVETPPVAPVPEAVSKEPSQEEVISTEPISSPILEALPEPTVDIDLLMEKVLQEEETIRLARETEQTLANLKAMRLQAKLNKNKVLTSEFNMLTGESKSNNPKFQVFSETNINLIEQKAKRGELSAREQAILNKRHVLNEEFDNRIINSQPEHCDVVYPKINNAVSELNKREQTEDSHDETDSSGKSKACQIPQPSASSQLVNKIVDENLLDEGEPPHSEPISSHSLTSSSENLVTVISNEVQNDYTSQHKQVEAPDKQNDRYKWSLETQIEDDANLDATFVEGCLEASIRVPLSIQYRLTNDAVLRLFTQTHRLADHLIVLRNFFFLMDGSFAKSLSDDLSPIVGNDNLLLLNPFKLNSILSKAISCGARHGGLEDNLSFVIQNVDQLDNLNESNVFEYITLSYKVEWPLNIVLTPEALKKYNKVFAFLIQIQRVVWTLQKMFSYLKMNKHVENDHLYIFTQVNLFRHVMCHVVSALQGYIHTSVLELPWQKLIQDVSQPVTLDAVYYFHADYVKQITFRCLLNQRSRVIAETLQELLKTVLTFHEELIKRPLHLNYKNLLPIFQRFLKITKYLYDYVKKLCDMGYQEEHLAHLLYLLALNNYFD